MGWDGVTWQEVHRESSLLSNHRFEEEELKKDHSTCAGTVRVRAVFIQMSAIVFTPTLENVFANANS